jgi:hypothetical protein
MALTITVKNVLPLLEKPGMNPDSFLLGFRLAFTVGMAVTLAWYWWATREEG